MTHFVKDKHRRQVICLSFGEVPLEVHCSECDGVGLVVSDNYCPPREVACYSCRGLGTVLTSDGDALRQFVEKYTPTFSVVRDKS